MTSERSKRRGLLSLIFIANKKIARYFGLQNKPSSGATGVKWVNALQEF